MKRATRGPRRSATCARSTCQRRWPFGSPTSSAAAERTVPSRCPLWKRGAPAFQRCKKSTLLAENKRRRARRRASDKLGKVDTSALQDLVEKVTVFARDDAGPADPTAQLGALGPEVVALFTTYAAAERRPWFVLCPDVARSIVEDEQSDAARICRRRSSGLFDESSAQVRGPAGGPGRDDGRGQVLRRARRRVRAFIRPAPAVRVRRVPGARAELRFG